MRSRATSLARRWPDAGALILVVLLAHLLPGGDPLGNDALGADSGARIALEALGIILVLRSNRIINFAQVQLGAVSGLLFLELVRHAQFVVWIHQLCPGCVPSLPADNIYLQTNPMVTTAILQHSAAAWLMANFWLSVVVALAFGPLLGWLAYVLVVRRFSKAPRLIATVVTIGIAQVCAAFAGWLPNNIFNDNPNPQPGAPPPSLSGFSLPFPDADVKVTGVHLHSGDIATFVVAALIVVTLALFFTRTRTGVRMRGVADNPDRAATLGISPTRVSSLSWLIAGGLSSLAAMLAVLVSPGGNAASQGVLDITTLVVILAAVVFARMQGMVLAGIASVALGVLAAELQWSTGSTIAFDGVLIALLAMSMLLQRQPQSRAEQEASAAYLGARETRPTPPELRDLGAVTTTRTWLFLILAIVVLGLPFVVSPSQLSLAIAALVYAMVGLSLLVLTGWAGQISLGQFGLAAVGGYVAAILGGNVGMPMPLSILIGAAVGAAVSAALGLPALRLRGTYLAVMTLAFAVAVSAVLLNPEWGGRFLPANLGRPLLLGIDFNDDRVYYYTTLGVLALTAVIVAAIRRSGVARVLIASRDNEQAAQSFGVNLLRTRLQVFALSGFLAALGGGMLAYQLNGAQAGSFTPDVSVDVFLMVLIGGLGSIVAPLLGATYFGLLLLLPGQLAALGTGAGVILVLMLVPGGLGALFFRVRDSFLRQVALRHRLVVPSLLADTGADSRRPSAAPIAPLVQRGGGAVYVQPYYRLTGTPMHADTPSSG